MRDTLSEHGGSPERPAMEGEPMRLDRDEAARRLAHHDHGVLSTLHTERGIDAVPVVYALDDDHIGIPIDTVKPKLSTRLQREANLDADPRATLLVDMWDPVDWDRLWWVRVRLTRIFDSAREDRFADLLANRYPQYRDKPFAHVMVFRVESVTGWSAS